MKIPDERRENCIDVPAFSLIHVVSSTDLGSGCK